MHWSWAPDRPGPAWRIALRQAGLEVLLLDRDRFPRDKVCGDFVSPRGLDSARTAGLPGGRPRPRSDENSLGLRSLRRSQADRRQYTRGARASEFWLGRPSHGLRQHPFSARTRARRRRGRRSARQRLRDRRGGGARVVRRWSRLARLSRALTDRRGRRPIGHRTRVGHRTTRSRSGSADAAGLLHGLGLLARALLLRRRRVSGFGWIFPISADCANVGVGAPKELITRHGLNLHTFFARMKARLNAEARALGTPIAFSEERGFPIRVYRGRSRYSFDGGILVGEAARLVDPDLRGRHRGCTRECAHRRPRAASTLRARGSQ